MASKGERKIEKRLATSKVRKIKRKEERFTIRSKPGPHTRASAVPVGFVLRDLLGIAKNMKEIKFILSSRQVKVDGRIISDYKFPVGLFDLVSIEKTKKNYRMVFDSKGRLAAEAIDLKEKPAKICKITGKKTIKGRKVQLETNDGRSIVLGKTGLAVGGTVKISLPEQKILAEFELKRGNIVYIIAGAHVGTIAAVREITEGTMKRPKLITLKPHEGEEIQTVEKNIFVIGEKKPELEVFK